MLNINRLFTESLQPGRGAELLRAKDVADAISIESRRAKTAEKTHRLTEKPPCLVAMKHIDLDTVVETVRVLRLMDDRTLLDKYNRSASR